MGQHNAYQGDWKGVSPNGFNVAQQRRSASHPNQQVGGHAQAAAHDNTVMPAPYNPQSTQAQYPQYPMPQTFTQDYTPGYTESHAYHLAGSQSHGQDFNTASMPVFTMDQTSTTVASGSDNPQADWTPMMDRWLQESTSEEPFRAFTVDMSTETDRHPQVTHQTLDHQVHRVSVTHGYSSKGKKGRGHRC